MTRPPEDRPTAAGFETSGELRRGEPYIDLEGSPSARLERGRRGVRRIVGLALALAALVAAVLLVAWAVQ